MKYKFYIFDMDLTLLDTLKTSAKSYEACFFKAGESFDESKMTLYSSETLPETYSRIDNPKCTVKEFIDTFEQTALESFTTLAKFYDDSLKIIHYLKNKGCKLGIVTNRPRVNIIDILKISNLENMFDSIVTSSDITIYKPNPDPILKCMKDINMKDYESCYIGDGYNDFLASSRANVDFYLIERYNQCYFECKNIIHSLEELMED